jgi:hypothetical protein
MMPVYDPLGVGPNLDFEKWATMNLNLRVVSLASFVGEVLK